MKYQDIKLRTRLNLSIVLIIAISFIALGFIIYSSQKEQIIENTEERMISHLNDMFTILNTHVAAKQDAVNISLNLAHDMLYKNGSINEIGETITVEGINQITKISRNYTINKWQLNGVDLYKNYDYVDLIKSRSVETATIFQKIEDGYLRISTNVRKTDGDRAVGTFIPNSSEVIKTIERGETYYGRAFVVNAYYLTAYEPIKINGEIKGILYVGVKEMDYPMIKKVFNDKKYFANGYPFMVQDDGTFIIHPSKEGENFAEANFFKQIISSKKGDYRSEYLWPENEEGKEKTQYFKYFEPYKSYVCVSIYNDDLYSSLNDLIILIILGVLISLIITSLVIALIIRPITKNISDIAKLSNEIAKGNLNVTIDNYNKDEIGQTAFALRAMVKKLQEIVKSIRVSSDNIASGSQQISSASQQLSQGASEQASSAEEVSSSMEEMSSNIQQNTDNANQTEKISNKASKDIHFGNEAFEQTVDSMRIITEKISIITEIARQTNILALNAAVEAARAGEHGKGFAVVAEEVRKLAARSQEAANDINETSKKSVSVAEKAGALLTEIIPNIENTAKLVQEITAASNEQSTGANQVNSGIQNLNVVTQQNASASEELATSAEELAGQAEQLTDIISFFKMKPTRIDYETTKKLTRKAMKHHQEANNNGNGQSIITDNNNKKAIIDMQTEEIANDDNFETF
jgi:methyl-accepting chemotaxis protein